jgi:fibronectin type 3 domain-containing protein
MGASVNSCRLIVPLIALVCFATQGHAASRNIRVDNPGSPCDLGAPPPNYWFTTTPDPFASSDGNGDSSQNPSTFFNPGTIVSSPAVFCVPPVALSSIWDPTSSNYDSGDPPNPASMPNPTPTIPQLTATNAVLYEWINPNTNNANSMADVPDAEVIVWTLPPSTSFNAALAEGGFEIEFDNWCNTNDYQQTDPNTGAPLGMAAPASAMPSFTWNGNKYVYVSTCGENGASFNGNDLLLNNSGVLIGYVSLTDVTTFVTTLSPSAPGWQLIAIPSGITAVSGNGSVTLTWSPSVGAASYNVYQSSTATIETPPVKTGIALATTQISGLSNGQEYFFSVTAVYSGIESKQSPAINATVLPAIPSGLSATLAGVTSINLKWAASQGATSYSVYEGSGSGKEATTPIASGITATSYTVSSLTPGQSYFFDLVAVDAGGKSQASNEASGTMVAAAPAGLSGSAGNGAISLSWTPSAGATSYNVYEGTTPGGEGTAPVMSSLTGTSTMVSGLTNGQKYYFKVAAVDAGGVSSQSNEASGTPTAPPSGGGGAADATDVVGLAGLLLIALQRKRARRPRLLDTFQW